MKSAIAYALLAAEAATVLATDKVVHYPFQKVKKPRSNLRKRAGPVQVTLGNAEVLYYANVTVGSNNQALEMQLDTGSSDVWMTDSSAAFCTEEADNCAGGTFTPSQSTSYKALSTIFNITYVDGTGSTGNYFTDTFTIGGATLSALEMGLATDTTIGTGIIGVGFDGDEAVCNDVVNCATYPTIVDQLVTQGKINSHAYSLWLDDLEASTGSILFGGVDTGKYKAPLIDVPIEKDEYSGSYTSFSVAFTGFTITKNGQVQTGFTSSGYSQQAILDSGTSLVLLPDDLFSSIKSEVGATLNNEVGSYVAPCSVGATNATFNFAFGGTGGPVINVPVGEFFIPLYSSNGRPYTSGGQAVCQFGILPADGDPVLFGDTFLRSAYVVYDLDNKLISLANTDFNSTTSHVTAIPSGTAGAPGVSSTATGGASGATYTSNGFLGGAQSTATNPAAAASSTLATGALLTQTSGTTASSATASASSTAKASAASHAFDMSSVLVLCASAGLALLGSALILF